jgi:hypothetical protein
MSGLLEDEETVHIPANLVEKYVTSSATDGSLSLRATADGAHCFFMR